MVLCEFFKKQKKSSFSMTKQNNGWFCSITNLVAYQIWRVFTPALNIIVWKYSQFQSGSHVTHHSIFYFGVRKNPIHNAPKSLEGKVLLTLTFPSWFLGKSSFFDVCLNPLGSLRIQRCHSMHFGTIVQFSPQNPPKVCPICMFHWPN